MDLRLNREIKAYCNDFTTARQLLKDHGAAFVEVKEQVDYYYQLPPTDSTDGTRRLKLRVEHGKGGLIYYCERQERGARTSRFQTASTDDPVMGDVLAAALGISAIVRKQRELWRKDNVVFNLDTVEGIGQILEVEVQAQDGRDIDLQITEYQRLFQPCLGDHIVGSNEDLVAPATPR
ncbi:MAG: class IV adenylate cyclase [Chloroflexota bacterium]|nr:class IV adenylate cyclase [Chloroflexota bacterium]MDE2684020.1 class IV adenylate cyclase [Chloroflexota bacterium]